MIDGSGHLPRPSDCWASHGKQTSSARANWWLSASLKRMISCCAAITRRNSAPPGRLTSQKFEIARWPFNIGSVHVHAPHHESFFLPFYISLSLSSISSYFFYISPGPQLGARRCECSSDSLPRREAGISSRCHGAMLPWLPSCQGCRAARLPQCQIAITALLPDGPSVFSMYLPCLSDSGV